MFAVGSFEEIIRRERQADTKQVVIFLFVRPTGVLNQDIIKDFEYIHYNSAGYCSIYAIGYTDDIDHDSSFKAVESVCNNEWYYSNRDYVWFKNKLEERIKWKYSGEIEILILQNNPGSENSLNFQNYVAINISKGLRDGYIDSFQAFMESLIRSTRSKICPEQVARDLANDRIRIKDIISDAIMDCKKIPTPVKEIIKDRIFYRSANTFSDH